jgi:cobalt-zinc-cadmium efflux system outer membrane protein
MLASRQAHGQAPTIDTSVPPLPGSATSLLGMAPGSGGGSNLNTPGAGAILGSRPGPTTAHGIPTALSNPGSAPNVTDEQKPVTAPQPEPIGATAPLFGSLDLPVKPEDEGPPGGLTLEMAIDHLLKTSPDLQGKYLEIPMARADVLQASLRANPILYADAQLMPYGQYSKLNLGGPPQYDVNVSVPLDVSHKRRARTLVAERAKTVLEAAYQDAVRQKLDDLYSAYVQVLQDRQTLRYSRESVRRQVELEARTRQLFQSKVISRSEYGQVRIQLRTSQISVRDAEAAYLKSRIALANLLNLPRGTSASLELRGTILDKVPPPPSLDELLQTALANRPDVVSYRLGVKRADADVRLARANRFSDVYVLLQPYTFQDNQPFGLKSAYGWAVGVTVPLPVFNRNQGAIERAKINVDQSAIQLSMTERQVIADVETAYTEYDVTRREVAEIINDVLKIALENRDEARKLFRTGETSIISYINAELGFSAAVKQYLDTAVRHRRSMLALNTAVGQRILP